MARKARQQSQAKQCTGSVLPVVWCEGKLYTPKSNRPDGRGKPRAPRCSACGYRARDGRLNRHVSMRYFVGDPPMPRPARCPNRVSLRRQKLGAVLCGPCTVKAAG